jgi:hypothetical protein
MHELTTRMTYRRRTGYLLSMVLICIGAVGILFSPSIGVRGGIEQRQFTTTQDSTEREVAATIVISQLELSYVQNSKGLAFMHGFVLISIATLFCGVHLFSLLRRRAWQPV